MSTYEGDVLTPHRPTASILRSFTFLSRALISEFNELVGRHCLVPFLYLDPNYLPESHRPHPYHQYPNILFFNFECTGNPEDKPTKSIVLGSSDQQ